MSIPDKVHRQDVKRTCQTMCKPVTIEWVRKSRKAYFRKARTFAVSYQLGLDSAPVLFESVGKYVQVGETQIHLNKKAFIKAGGKLADYIERDGKAYVPFRRYLCREWVDVKTGEIVKPDSFLKQYSWDWTGHYNTYIGKLWKPKKKLRRKIL